MEGDELVLDTGAGTAKGRALARDPRLVLCVDPEVPPYGVVQVQCEGVVSEDPDELVRTATAVDALYMGAGRGEESGSRNGPTRVGRPLRHAVLAGRRVRPGVGGQARRDWSWAGTPRSLSLPQPSARWLIFSA